MVEASGIDQERTVIKLDGSDYAIIVPGQIVFALDAQPEEVTELIKTIHHNFKEKEPQQQALKTINLTLLPTTDCNLRCVYCYSRGGERTVYMDQKVAKAAIEAVSKKFKTENIGLTFAGGGEPFLNFELMKKAHKQAQNLFETVYLSVVTNGTFDSEQRQWLIENEVSTRISFDSIFQTKQRPSANGKPSQEFVKENIRTLLQLGHGVMIQCIITKQAVGKMVEALKYLASLGVKLVKMPPMLSSEISRGGRSMVPTARSYVEGLLDVLDYIAEKELPIKIDTGYFSKPSMGAYCGANGKNIIITPWGTVTSCVETIRESDPYANPFLYGRVSPEESSFLFDSERLDKLHSLHYTYRDKCSRCEFRLLCGGGCPMENVWATGFPPKPASYRCQVEYQLLPELLTRLARSSKYENMILDNVSIC